jgi:trans-aconitate methyltransferase
VQTIQLTAQVDADGVLRVQMPDRLKNTTVEAMLVFTTTESSKISELDRSSSPSLEDSVSWAELVRSLAGAWAEDFPSLQEIRTGSLDIERERL